MPDIDISLVMRSILLIAYTYAVAWVVAHAYFKNKLSYHQSVVSDLEHKTKAKAKA